MKQHSRILTHRSRHFFFSLCGNVLHQRVKSQRPNLKRAYCSFLAFLALYFKPTTMDKSLGTLLHSEVLSNAHRPNPSPHAKNKVGRVYLEQIYNFFSQFQLCIGWGTEDWKKISKRMHFFMREHRIERKI